MSALHHLLDDADILVTSVSYFHFREVYRISMPCHFPRFVVTREMNSKWYLCLPPETILEFVPSRGFSRQLSCIQERKFFISILYNNRTVVLRALTLIWP